MSKLDREKLVDEFKSLLKNTSDSDLRLECAFFLERIEKGCFDKKYMEIAKYRELNKWYMCEICMEVFPFIYEICHDQYHLHDIKMFEDRKEIIKKLEAMLID